MVATQHAQMTFQSSSLGQRKEFDVAKKDLGTFRLEENLSRDGKGVGSLVGQLAVHVLLHVPILIDQLHYVPLAVRLFKFVGRVSEACYVLKFPFVEAIDLQCASGRSCDALSVFAGECRAVGHPKIAGAAFVDLKLDRTRPDFSCEVRELGRCLCAKHKLRKLERRNACLA